MKMNILINTSNLYVGGGLQVALSFINELKQLNNSHEYHIFISQTINEQLDQNIFPDNFKFYLIEKSPASLKTRKRIVGKLAKLEKEINPDIVFSVFGPSYWRPSTIHLLGFADGWVYNPTSIAYDKLSFFNKMKMRLHTAYKVLYIKKDADYYVIETNDAKIKLANTVRIEEEKIFVVGNTYSNVFDENEYLQITNKFYIKLPPKKENEFRFIYIAHNHPSKNLAIINEILPFLDGYNVKFVLTIDAKSFTTIFSNIKYKDMLINVGPIPQKSCPSLYAQCDALFAPTLLETFSAAYPEAMIMKIPILTSNYSFATDVCADAGLYFDPLNPQAIAEKVKILLSNKLLQADLIEKGKKRIQSFETARSRAEKYIALCENLYLKGK